MADSKITVEIVGDKKNLDSVLGGVDNDVNSLGANMAKVGKAIGAAVAAGFVAIGVGAVEAVQQFNSFEKGMNEVFTLLPGISGKAMREMQDQVLAFSNEMNVLPEEVVPALYQALSAGVPKNNVFDFLETAVKLSKGGVTDLETAVDGLSSVVNAYGKETITAEEASDIMFTTVRLGKTTIGELAGELADVTPIAAALGVNFGDVGAAIATITSQGTPTAQAVTGLRQMLVELGDSGSDVGKKFEAIAGQSFPEFIASGHDLGDAMEIIQQISDDTGIPVSQLFSSIEAGTVATQLTGKSLDKFKENLEEMGLSAGATQKAYDQMKEGLSEAFDSLGASLAVLAIEVGRELAPAVKDVAKLLDENSDEIAAFVKDAVNAGVSVVKAAVKALSDFMSVFSDDSSTQSKEVQKLVNAHADGTVDITSSWKDLSKAMKNLTFGEFFGALVKDFTTVSQAEQDFTDSIADGMKGAVTFVLEFVRATIDLLTMWADNILTLMINAFGWVPGLGDKLRAAQSNVRQFRIDSNAEIDQLEDEVDVFFEGHDNVSDKIDVIRANIRDLQTEIYAKNPPGDLLDPTQGGPRISGPGITTGGLNPYDEGGVIPGVPGAAVPILAHAGETVLPTHRMSADAAMRHVGLTRDDVAWGTAAGMQMASVGFGDSTHIGTVNVQSRAASPDDLVDAIREQQRRHALLAG